MNRHTCPSCKGKINFLSLIFIAPGNPFTICKACESKLTRTDIKEITSRGLIGVFIFTVLKEAIEPIIVASILIAISLVYDYYNVHLRLYTDSELVKFTKFNNFPLWLGNVCGFILIVTGIIFFTLGMILNLSSEVMPTIEFNLFLAFLICLGLFSIYYGYKLLFNR